MTARLLFAAPESGSGKTLITAGIGLAFRQRGLRVQMFKCGPDYIDPTYHQLASGRPCRNLDSWMLSPSVMTDSFVRNSRHADIALIEGVMGLFDGFDVSSNEGSSADIGRILSTPIVLILPVRGQARSAAATALGFARFSADTQIAGIILNKVGSARHADLCQQAIETETGIPVLGYLPRNADFVLPERHLGLIPTDEQGEWEALLHTVAAQVAQTVDLDALSDLAHRAPAIEHTKSADTPTPSIASPSVRIAVAADEAFTFTYPENVEMLAEAGAEIVPFSPLYDHAIPAAVDGLILSGGFPEIYAAALSQNESMQESIRQMATSGRPIYAECGGLMYLTAAITDHAGKRHPMVGALPGECAMTERVKLGYRLVEAVAGTPLLAAGEQVRGHEFHYSVYHHPTNTTPCYHLHDPRGKSDAITPAGIQHGAIWASYIHLHFLTNRSMAHRFVRVCQQERITL